MKDKDHGNCEKCRHLVGLVWCEECKYKHETLRDHWEPIEEKKGDE